MKMPEGTVFCKYEPCIFGHLQIKTGNCGDIDFFALDELWDIDASGSDERNDILLDYKLGEHIELRFDLDARDGLFDKDQLFAVFEKEDVKGMIKLLTECL